MVTGDLIVMDTPQGPVIRQADPRILIADEFLTEMREGTFHEPAAVVVGDVLTLTAINQTVVYRLTGERDSYGSWYAEWPD